MITKPWKLIVRQPHTVHAKIRAFSTKKAATEAAKKVKTKNKFVTKW